MKPKRNYMPGSVDDCQTPGYAIEPILPILNRGSRIWEPAVGEGILAAALRRHGFDVIATSYDFLTGDPPSDFDAVVTNPPYSIKHLFLKRCVELGKPWFLLMPVEAIATWRVQQYLDYEVPDGTPKLGILIPTKRINFKMPGKGWAGNAQFPVAWYCGNVSVRGIRIYNAAHWTREYRQRFEVERSE